MGILTAMQRSMTSVSQSTNTVRGAQEESRDRYQWPSENQLKKTRRKGAPEDLICGVRTFVLGVVWMGLIKLDV